MKAAVLNFTPRAELGPLENVDSFIALCKVSLVLNAKTQFERDTWDVGYVKGQNKVIRAVFSTLEASSLSKPLPALPAPFLDFAKAILIYLEDKRPVTSPAIRLAALRCLESALRHSGKGSRPTATDESVLDAAVALARKQMGASAAYRVAGQLEAIADFMRTKEFASFRQRWHHGLKKPSESNSRISKEALKARQEKLPSAAKLRALGGIFYEATQPSDVMVSSVSAVMLCAPERINEVLRLQRNCIVEGEGEYRGGVGLRWPGSKGFENTTKWIPTEMVPIARESISNIIKVSEPAHKLAAWYSENPKTLYLHEDAKHLRGKRILTPGDIALILWGDETAKVQAKTWANTTNRLEPQDLGQGRKGFLFEDVQRSVVAMLPLTFPFMPGAPELKCQDASMVMRTNEMHASRATYLCMFTCVDHAIVTNQFGRNDRASIFERFGYTEDDGSAIELRSHSLRHYLNMLAQVGGLSSAEIAIFSGRKDARQNRQYDHMSSQEVQAPISRALKAGFNSDLDPLLAPSRNLVARSDFNGLGLTAAHTTEYGWCAHDFAAEPCQMHRDCVNCEEQECIKGEEHKERNLRFLKVETENLLRRAKEALSDEEYGADTWVKHQTRTLERATALLSILDDPSVANGARIKLDVANAPLITASDVHPVRMFRTSRRKSLQ